MLLAIIVFIFIISLLISIHEFGHLIAAKKSGVRVEEFGLGIPPRIWGKKIGETIYSLNAIPLGGFVKLHGEDGEEDSFKDPESFASKSILARAVILLAGVAMNAIFAVICFYFLMTIGGFQSQMSLIFDYHFPFGQQQNFIGILIVEKGSPAEKAGLQPYDVVLTGNGNKFENSDQFAQFIGENKGREIVLKVKNLDSEEVKQVIVTPRIDFPENQGPLGVGLNTITEIKYSSLPEKATVGFIHSFNIAHYSMAALGHFIKASFVEQTIKPLADTVSGPIGILAITKLTVKEGFVAVLNLMAFISLALAMMNTLPFPGLDGGRLTLLGFELVTRKRIPATIERNINLAGILLLIVLLILVSYKDILQFKDVLF